jgi:group I intron endonuclease
MGQILQTFGVIYKITNLVNAKVYIGQTTFSMKDRLHSHCKGLFCTKLSRAIRKYGKENFVIEQIDSANNRLELNQKEIYWISHYNAIKEGYNIREGGINGKMNPESVEKMRQSQIKRFEGKISGVYQFDLSGNLLKVWRSEREILQTLGFKVGDALQGKRSIRNGYVWLRENNKEKAISLASKARLKNRKLVGTDGVNSFHFESLIKACNHFKVSNSAIISAMNRNGKSCGLYWRYL